MMGMNNFKGRKGGFAMSMLKRLFWGIGAAALTYVVVPKMRKMAKPAVDKGKSSVKVLADRGKQGLGEYKFHYKDKSEKAPYTSTEEQGHRTINDQLAGIVSELQARVSELQEEIEKFRLK